MAPFLLLILLLTQALTSTALAPIKTSPLAPSVATLRSLSTATTDSDDATSLLELTKALVQISRESKPDRTVPWSQKLGGPPSKSWIPIFSASQEVIQSCRRNNETAVGRFLPPGISCLTFSATTNETGTVCNALTPFGGSKRVATFRIEGIYTMKDRTMTLEFQQLTIQLLNGFLSLPSLDIREGRGIRSLLERIVRGGKKNSKSYEKRPNIYIWFYADEEICVAQGSSGSVAVWVAAKDEEEAASNNSAS